MELPIDNTLERTQQTTFKADLFWIFALATVQWVLFGSGIYLELYDTTPLRLASTGCVQFLFQLAMYYAYQSKLCRKFGVDTLLLLHLSITGIIMLVSAFFAKPYSLELSLFFIPIIFLGSRIAALSSKLILTFLGISGFLLILLLQSYFHSSSVKSIWHACGYVSLCLLATVASIRTGSFILSLKSKSHQLQDALRLIKCMTVKDEVTGLFNNRYINDLISQQKSLADRSQYHFVVAMISIDNIVEIESEHSLVAKDEVLKLTAKIISSHIRSVDSCGRWQDGCFLLVFINTSPDAAKVILDRINLSISDHNLFGLGIDEPLQLSSTLS